MDLKKLEGVLQKNNFDTSVADNVLAASRNTGDTAVEITIDSSGGCLVKKTISSNLPSKSIELAGQKISKVSNNLKISQIRLKINSEENISALLKIISTPRF